MPAPRKSLNNKRWRKIRRLVLQKEPLCRFCMEQGIIKAAEEVDHIGHEDDHSMDNLRPLCKPCHSRRTWYQMRGKEPVIVGKDGAPSDWE